MRIIHGTTFSKYVGLEDLILNTPYSMNRLFSELFRKIGGAFLEVCETISGGIWQVLRGKIKENYSEKNKKK